ncbi:glycoside hydrolase family 3 N-terminal domain-containing protein [Alkalicoccus halolimnae]|uniref:beta-glucosidase n=1 Tax=Alkalicoccus halolimnae TaxID=1667239 RepID=A0A5C7FB26_9BACI|nr:glycoside hydrolase family 3 N-terminal domain-containing protein [Alkalicoccus halolimnae]TXF83597.1 beta-glucosidase [Alkalicoccus halolimnae]
MEDIQLTELLGKMTLDEKIEQMTQVTAAFINNEYSGGAVTGPFAEMDIAKVKTSGSGSVLGEAGAAKLNRMQKNYIDNHRLQIPLLFMADIIHGYKTIFPVPLAIGCSWDIEAAEYSAKIAAQEAAASGLHVTFSPMVDLVRDPRWGRVMESTGEDRLLNSLFAEAFVKGYQGKDLKNTDTLAACVKHFAAYGAPEGGRDYNTVDVSERELYEQYLPAYKAAIDAGANLVMTAFNTVDGIPATSNRPLLRGKLREGMKFNGVLISDWGAVQEAIPHGVAENKREAAKKSALAGVDIEMMTPCYLNHLKELVEEGEVEEDLLDESVLRILQLKNKLGLFENPYRGADEETERIALLTETHRERARELAADSCVLLKNKNDVLPLTKSAKVALIGPFAESKDLMGAWSIYGEEKDVVSLAEGMTSVSSSLLTAMGSGIHSTNDYLLEEARQKAEEADVIVLALGEHSEMSGEAGSRSQITLPQAQLRLAEAVRSFGKPIITVLFNGRPLDVSQLLMVSDAVLEAWFPGSEGGHAVSDLLYGKRNPSGRLTMSFPYNAGQIPVYYNHYNTGRPKKSGTTEDRFLSQYLDVPNEPQFPFGFGLSYTSFTYGSMSLSRDTFSQEEPLEVTVDITNSGSCWGREVVQLYTQDVTGEVVRPVNELKDFRLVKLNPGETETVRFHVDTSMLGYYHSDLSWDWDPGAVRIRVGRNSEDTQEKTVTLTKISKG